MSNNQPGQLRGVSKLPRISKGELLLRVEVVRRLILEGRTRNEIIRNVAEQYKIKPRQCENYIKKARLSIQEEARTLEPNALAEHIAHRRDLRRRAAAAGKMVIELAAAEDEAKLLGLYHMIDALVNIDMTKLTDAQLERLSQGENIFTVLATPSRAETEPKAIPPATAPENTIEVKAADVQTEQPSE